MPDTIAQSLVFIISFSSFDNPVKDYLLSTDAKMVVKHLVGYRIGIPTRVRLCSQPLPSITSTSCEFMVLTVSQMTPCSASPWKGIHKCLLITEQGSGYHLGGLAGREALHGWLKYTNKQQAPPVKTESASTTCTRKLNNLLLVGGTSFPSPYISLSPPLKMVPPNNVRILLSMESSNTPFVILMNWCVLSCPPHP